MTYDEFLAQPIAFYQDIVKLIATKHRYRLEFTKEEKEFNYYILQYEEDMKINELRNKFEKCWEQEE